MQNFICSSPAKFWKQTTKPRLISWYSLKNFGIHHSSGQNLGLESLIWITKIMQNCSLTNKILQNIAVFQQKIAHLFQTIYESELVQSCNGWWTRDLTRLV